MKNCTILHRRVIIMLTGKDAVAGLTARAKLLSGTKPRKLYHPEQIGLRTYTKDGSWINVVHDFNSVSPSEVVTSFGKVSSKRQVI